MDSFEDEVFNDPRVEGALVELIGFAEQSNRITATTELFRIPHQPVRAKDEQPVRNPPFLANLDHQTRSALRMVIEIKHLASGLTREIKPPMAAANHVPHRPKNL